MKTSAVDVQCVAAIQALRFLTLIPVPVLPVERRVDWQESERYSALYYPAVGLLIGLVVSLVGFMLLDVFNSLLAAAVLVSVWVYLSGALHLDGLADCADAWVGGLGSREKTLSIMKDPACGPVAVCVTVLLLLLKIAALNQLVGAGLAYVALLLAPVAGRLSIVVLILTSPYVRSGGLGENIALNMPRSAALALCIGIMLVFFISFPGSFLMLLLALAVLIYLIRRAALTRLSGCTGDVFGAAVELTELVVLLVFCLLS